MSEKFEWMLLFVLVTVVCCFGLNLILFLDALNNVPFYLALSSVESICGILLSFLVVGNENF